MRYLWSQAAGIRAAYAGDVPLAHVLKTHFQKHPALGSRDRKLLSALLYAWHRCGKGLSFRKQNANTDDQELMQAALLLTHQPGLTHRLLPPHWLAAAADALPEQTAFLATQGIDFELEKLLPQDIVFSLGIDRKDWLISMLSQPRLFLRVRRQHARIEALLHQAGIAHEWLTKDCLALPNRTQVEKLLPASSYVIQDISSQQTGAYMHPAAGEDWWDVCAGAGGKSLLLADKQREVQLTASDVRARILQNLENRFRQYQLPLPRMCIIDAANEADTRQKLGGETFDGIICDVPCSGSGTWARTPENLYFFRPETLDHYTQKQSAILNQAARRLRPGGRLIYITCSVFQAENEMVVQRLQAQQPMEILAQQLINGLKKEADSLFVTLLRCKE